MALSPPKTGAKVSLTADFGEGPGRLHEGSEGRVEGVHAPGTPGVGHAGEEIVLVAFTQPGHEAPRVVSVNRSDYEQLFKNVRKARSTNGR